MITISFEDCVGVFKITDESAFLKTLYHYLNKQRNVKELFDTIIIQLSILDLVKETTGIKIFCKECDVDFFPDQIQIEKMGTYADPESIEKKWDLWSWMKGLFEQKKPEMKVGRIGRFGGEKIICPRGHELLSVIRWIS